MSRSLAIFLVVVASGIGSMVVYALLGRRRDADAERKGAHFLLGAGDFFVHWFMWALSPAERLALRLRLKPDVFNIAGLAFGLASGVLIGTGHLELGAWAIGLGGASDVLDGRIARARRLDSDYGKFIDSTIDRYVEVFAFVGFAVYLRDFPLGPVVTAAALAGSLLVSYTRARGESLGVVCREGLMQRAERFVLTFLVCLLDPMISAAIGRRPGTAAVWVLGLIAVGTFGTAVYRTIVISSRLLGPR